MMRNTIIHKFVDFIPEKLEEGILYVSVNHCVAIHKCICGCENEVVTPIATTEWKLMFDGETVSLSPSIGNWNFKCRSHYWIKNNRIIIANSRNEDKPMKKKKKSKKNFFQFWKK
jgi:hypothetical protein